jgi:hypothetical protein
MSFQDSRNYRSNLPCLRSVLILARKSQTAAHSQIILSLSLSMPLLSVFVPPALLLRTPFYTVVRTERYICTPRHGRVLACVRSGRVEATAIGSAYRGHQGPCSQPLHQTLVSVLPNLQAWSAPTPSTTTLLAPKSRRDSETTDNVPAHQLETLSMVST